MIYWMVPFSITSNGLKPYFKGAANVDVELNISETVQDRDIQCVSKNQTATINMTLLHQFTTFTNFGTERPYSILQWLPYDKKFLNWLRTSCVVSITTVATLHTWTADFWANFEQRIISKRVAKRLWACVNAERQHSNICYNCWYRKNLLLNLIKELLIELCQNIAGSGFLRQCM